MTTYFEKLEALTPGLVAELEGRGIEARYLRFGGSGELWARQVVPTDARSEFLANRAMGDWAEDLLAAGLERALPRLRVVRYGDSDRMAAGEEGFREFYTSRSEDVRVHGKRPDLLVVPSDSELASDVSGSATAAIAPLVRRARLAIEVRSSKTEALRYMRVREQRRAQGQRAARETPSFTVEVEDLRVVHRWIEAHGVEQVYCQVFFDSVFAINMLDIFRIIAGGGGFQIENPARNQQKTTILIPILSGERIDAAMVQPGFEVERRVTEVGRHDVYVRPVGGSAEIDPEAFRRVCVEPRTLR